MSSRIIKKKNKKKQGRIIHLKRSTEAKVPNLDSTEAISVVNAKTTKEHLDAQRESAGIKI